MQSDRDNGNNLRVGLDVDLPRLYLGPTIAPAIVVPWQPALSNADIVVPALLDIAAQGFTFLNYPAQPAAQTLNMAANYVRTHEEFTHLINLDIDHVHPPDTINKLCELVGFRQEIKIAGGINYMRQEPHSPCYWVNEDGCGIRIGFGCTIVSRELFEVIEPPWFMYDYSKMTLDPDYQYPGPDMYFCNKAVEAGYEIFVHPDLTSPHISTKLITRKEYENLKE